MRAIKSEGNFVPPYAIIQIPFGTLSLKVSLTG